MTFNELLTHYGKTMGFQPGYWPQGMPTGILPGTLSSAALGGLLGTAASYPLSWLAPRLNPKKLRWVLGLGGAALGATPFVPGLFGAGQEGLFNKSSNDKSKLRSSEDSIKRADIWAPNMPPIPAGQAMQSIDTAVASGILSPLEGVIAARGLINANQGKERGLINHPVQSLAAGLIGAGVGYGAARVAGALGGALFGLDASTQKQMALGGGLAGAALNLFGKALFS